MPEMPEVEQVRKTLAPRITNKKITSVEVYLDRLVKHPTVGKLVEGLTGKSILEVGRKGKYLVPTKDGNNLVCVLPEQITSPSMWRWRKTRARCWMPFMLPVALRGFPCVPALPGKP